VVLLEAGDRISADLRVLTTHALAVDESMLTGESASRRIETGQDLYAGTFAVEGAAEAQVTATGSTTRIAGIAPLTRQVHRPPGPLQVRLNRVIRIIGLIAVGAGALLYLVGLGLGLTALQGFLFALGVTVALVPEGLLPMVALALALGARAMAGRKAFGASPGSGGDAGAVWTPAGVATVHDGHIQGCNSTRAALAEAAYTGGACL
jgi:P-type E1-E2 ATPase